MQLSGAEAFAVLDELGLFVMRHLQHRPVFAVEQHHALTAEDQPAIFLSRQQLALTPLEKVGFVGVCPQLVGSFACKVGEKRILCAAAGTICRPVTVRHRIAAHNAVAICLFHMPVISFLGTSATKRSQK